MKNLYESIKTNLNEGENYKYIDGANYEKHGYDMVYNSEANTDVRFIVAELQRYFEESAVAAKDTIANATHDTGIYDNDVEMCNFCAEKCQEMLDKMDETWQ